MQTPMLSFFVKYVTVISVPLTNLWIRYLQVMFPFDYIT